MVGAQWTNEVKRYLISLRAGNASSSYVKNTEATLRHLGTRFEPASLLDLTRSDLETWFAELRQGGLTGKRPLADATMDFYAAITRAFLRWLNDGDAPPAFKGLKKIGKQTSRIEGRDDLLTDDELARILRVMDTTKRLVFRLLRATGARPSEILNLQRRDIETVEHEGRTYAQVTFRNTKNGTHRTVPVADMATMAALQEHLEITPNRPDAILFPSRQGGVLNYESLTAYLKKKARLAGIEKNVYSQLFRHIKATELLTAPRPIADRLMGWKSGNMWKNYTHLQTDDLRDFVLEHTELPEGPEATRRTVREEVEAILGRLQNIEGLESVSVSFNWADDVTDDLAVFSHPEVEKKYNDRDRSTD